MTIREEVEKRIRQDPELNRIRRKIENGNATYADTSAYSIRSGKLLGEILSGHILDIPVEDREQLCVDLLHDRYVDINLVVDEVQSALDAAQGLRIAPRHAPENTERSHQIGTSLRDPTKPDDVIQRRAGAATETATKAVHDDRMESEAKFRKEAGLKSYLNRVAAAGCCPWCSKIAGRYVYGDHPEDIFGRHDNCDCSVTFESGRQRQDVWSKKTWETPGIGAGAGDLTVLTEEQAAGLQQKRTLHMLTKLGDRDIINHKVRDHLLNVFNESEYGLFDFIDIENNLMQSDIGRIMAAYIEDDGINITMDYSLDSPENVMGWICGKDITVFAVLHEDETEVAKTIIHECAHRKYNWDENMEGEINCRLLEHFHTHESITETEIQKIVDFVRNDYSYLPEGDLYGY